VLIDGRPIERKRVKIGYLPEERGLYPKKAVAYQMAYFAR
jgi:ABC-2 type transport system ATP-binding protein